MAYNNQESRPVDDGIANSHEQVQVLRGIQPKHQMCYKFYKFCKTTSILLIAVDLVFFGLTFVDTFDLITRFKIYRLFILAILAFSLILIVLGLIDRALFLRRAPFDDWVYEISEKRLGTSIIFYDSKYIYLNYDRGGKEVDKREFITEMSDKSVHYSYYYIMTDIDSGYIQVECKKRQPIPNKASFSPNDDKFWNIIPMGLTIHPTKQSIAPIGWYLNDQNINEELYSTIPSTSILICGGTGCYDKDTPILMYDTLIH